jgi:predicted nucleotidyltransferase component of viral defense system
MEYHLMNLHTDPTLFQDAIAATAQQFAIPEIYIEKDYWITAALKLIFASPAGNDAVFKGGTALSKCHKLIERFSEDIDLVVLKRSGETDNQLKKKIRYISKLVETLLPEVPIPGITQKVGMIRKTAHQYQQKRSGDYGQVREQIILEATWLGNAEPFTNEYVNCYIADMMARNDQAEMIQSYGLQKFPARVLTKERTFCEKVMSLVRFSHTTSPYIDLAKKIRHVYDIHMILQHPDMYAFLRSAAFDKMMVSVGKDDIEGFKNNNRWLSAHPREAIIFSSPAKTWEAIKSPYRTTFKDLVMGELPADTELIKSLELVSSQLATMKWLV